MVTIDVREATEVIRKAYGDVSKKAFRRQAARALNHTAAKAKTGVAREIRKEYSIKSREIKRQILIRRASAVNLVARVSTRGASLPLSAFPHSQNRRGVSVKIRKRREVIQKAFVATLRSGKKSVFARGEYSRGGFTFRYRRLRPSGDNDLPITMLRTTSVPQAMSKPKVINALIAQAETDYPKRLAYLLGRSSAFGPSKYV